MKLMFLVYICVFLSTGIYDFIPTYVLIKDIFLALDQVINT